MVTIILSTPPSWNHVIAWKLLVLDRNTWNYITVCKLFSLRLVICIYLFYLNLLITCNIIACKQSKKDTNTKNLTKRLTYHKSNQTKPYFNLLCTIDGYFSKLKHNHCHIQSKSGQLKSLESFSSFILSYKYFSPV